jgi:8-oxo-dGTP pyrophosphatase MutT (NUDIX family)
VTPVDSAGSVATPRDAATVVLLRDGVDGVETWLMRRVDAMTFAPGMSVFPGGSVDPTDADLEVSWSGPGPADFAADFGCEEGQARGLVTAAARETFEETGVLLAVPATARTAEIDIAREAVENHELAFSALLIRLGCALDTAGLRPWSRWITPEFAPKRFDTRFFVAALPSGAVASAVTSEAREADWVPVRRAVTEWEAGERPMFTPTIATLTTIAGYESVAEVLAGASERDLAPTPTVRTRLEDGSVTTVAGGLTFVTPAGKPHGHGAAVLRAEG